MDSVEDYARQWAKHEKEDVDSHSEWIIKGCEVVDTNQNSET